LKLNYELQIVGGAIRLNKNNNERLAINVPKKNLGMKMIS